MSDIKSSSVKSNLPSSLPTLELERSELPSPKSSKQSKKEKTNKEKTKSKTKKIKVIIREEPTIEKKESQESILSKSKRKTLKTKKKLPKIEINSSDTSNDLQNKIETLYNSTNFNDISELKNFEFQKEIAEYNNLKTNATIDTENEEYKELENLYPSLNDPLFNVKIANKKEFNDVKYDETIYDVEEQSDVLCNAEFELSPHQLFVRNFLSFQTPYNSLLLYHGLGTGKTCSAIGVAEEMRDYMKQMGISKKIIVIASPNVQENFKLQLFDERKLKEIDGLWNLRACTGNRFLKEINPMNMKGLTREKIISQIKRIINDYYLFMGYIEFANYIERTYNVEGDIDDRRKKILIREKLKKEFSGSLIIIDEVHNIRNTDDNKDKRVSTELIKLVENVDNLRLLLLSATPMYNSYKEIIWLINLMSLNDRRPLVSSSDIFNSDGSFVKDENGKEIGKELLERKSIGYISFVKGDNPYIFPFRIWPSDFSPETSIKNEDFIYPRLQLNDKPIENGINMIDINICEIGEYQENGYKYIMENIRGDDKTFENMESIGYSLLQRPIQALNMVYPNERFDRMISGEDITIDISEIVGSNGLNNIMKFKETTAPPQKKEYEYKSNTYGRVFSQQEIGKYSGKIKNICESILNSTGIVLIYSEYIDGGLVPIVLALEEMGFTRYGTTPSLFKTPPTRQIDAIHFKEAGELPEGSKFYPAKYTMITGDKYFSPDNLGDIKILTSLNNTNGERIKVVLISQAGAEGIDFKFIRQIHIMEPWYNMNRIEQIIGRGVRNCSHKDLPFNKRNVMIFLYGTKFLDYDKEAADLYIYRYAERKAVQIGLISRIIKENAIDCLLNNRGMNYSVERIDQKHNIELSNKKIVEYKIGEKSYDVTCDYMEKCLYECKPFGSLSELGLNEEKLNTYNESFIFMNIDKITNRIRQLFKDKFFYKKIELIKNINIIREYPIIQINAALNQLIEDKSEFISDKYGRLGKLINIEDYYLFQPLELSSNNISLYERSVPIDYKFDNIMFQLPKKKIGDIDYTYIKKTTEKPKEDIEQREKSKENIEGKGIEESEEQDIDEGGVEETKGEPISVIKKVKKSKIITEVKNDYMRDIIREIELNYTNATTKQLIMRGEEDWYKYFSLVSNKLLAEGEFNIDDINLFLIQHILETMEYNKKINLLNYLYANDESELSELMRNIKNVFNRDINNIRNLRGIIIYKEIDKANQIQLLIFRDNQWKIAQPEDILDFKDIIKSKSYNLTDINNIIGFTIHFKNTYMIFKVKNMKLKRHIGARCDQAGKTDAIKILNSIIDKDEYDEDNTKGLNKKELCIRQEMYLRLYNKNRKNNKIWYLDPIEATMTNIEKMSFVK